mgnify:CR=1 FL=1|jgi:hybrid cluster-associated redox disulfide protein
MHEFKINEDTVIMDLLYMDIDVAQIFAQAGLHCMGCAFSINETIGEAAMAHGIDPKPLIENLRAYFGVDEVARA